VLTDTFSVSTGNKNHPTPDINMRPNGPTYIKYSSRKYPGGNYQGLGNMPYVVFIKGGYAVHGTTPGNFLKLGHRASHGCVRLHPDNAKLVYELVNTYGLENTWVTVTESL
jgi:lipoprotein-anchoring transpeptidase ErfK/SrfK